MADASYIKGIDSTWGFLLTDPINVVFCTSAYTRDVSASGDEFLSDIPSGARILTVALSGKTLVAGVFDALDVTFSSTPAGMTATQAIIYRDASPESGARLLRNITDATNFPITFTGGAFTFVWPNDVKKIFRIRDL